MEKFFIFRQRTNKHYDLIVVDNNEQEKGLSSFQIDIKDIDYYKTLLKALHFKEIEISTNFIAVDYEKVYKPTIWGDYQLQIANIDICVSDIDKGKFFNCKTKEDVLEIAKENDFSIIDKSFDNSLRFYIDMLSKNYTKL